MGKRIRRSRALDCRGVWHFIAAILIAGVLVPQSVQAEVIRIVAIGASNTNGKGVKRFTAWPAQLQTMLRAKGFNAQVVVNAVNGSTTSQMRARLKGAATPGTRIAILSIPLTNDRRRKVDTHGNIASMRATLEKLGIKIIIVARPHVWAEHQLQKDRIHFTVAGHKTVATKLLPAVIEQLGKPN